MVPDEQVQLLPTLVVLNNNVALAITALTEPVPRIVASIVMPLGATLVKAIWRVYLPERVAMTDAALLGHPPLSEYHSDKGTFPEEISDSASLT